MGYFQEKEFQDRMLALLSRDQKFCRKVGSWLSTEDFKPRRGSGPEERARHTVAMLSLPHWKDYRQPIGSLLRTEALDWIRQNRNQVGEKDRRAILDLVEEIGTNEDLWNNPEKVEQLVIDYKQRRRIKNAIENMMEIQSNGGLDMKQFISITRQATKGVDYQVDAREYKTGLEDRIKEREQDRLNKLPLFMIESVDEQVSMAPRGQVNLALAKYGVGKTHFMCHLARVLAIQEYKVLFFTLEDPAKTIEAKLDAALSGIAVEALADFPNKLRRIFEQQIGLMRGRIRVIGAMGGGWSVQRMEEWWEVERNRGYQADVVIVDYDKKIQPPGKKYDGESAERMKSADIYQELTNWAQRDNIYLWVAAQARRKGSSSVIVTGDDAAEDINKLREAGFCMGIGWGPANLGLSPLKLKNTRFLFVAKNRFGRAEIGWPIRGNFRIGMIYDRFRTQKIMELWKQSRGIREDLDGRLEGRRSQRFTS